MVETKNKLVWTVNESAKEVPVIIVAAGSSSRMQGIDKRFLKLGEIPLIIRTLKKFEASKYIKNIILVTKKSDILPLQALAEQYEITKLSDIVEGGACRQESVKNGFARLSREDEFVLIHDGARPFVTEEIIGAVVLGFEKYKAVTCAVKVKDTIKQINENGEVLKTLKREELVAVQTPQGVCVSDYLSALENIENLDVFTDDMSIMEAAGHKVLTVSGSYNNIKVTTPEDIALAEAILREEEKCE